MNIFAVAAASVLAVGACAFAYAAGPTTDAGARITDGKGGTLGTVLFHQTPQGVKIDIALQGLTQGPHAIHIHAVGKCDPAGGFKSAGAHFDVGGHQHGKAPSGHSGDMDNVTANKYGIARATVMDTTITLGPGPNSLFDADGSSVVVHAGPDDYKSQPAGNSGDRIACGVIKPM